MALSVIGMDQNRYTEQHPRNNSLKNIKMVSELLLTPLDPSTAASIASLHFMNEAGSAASPDEPSDLRSGRLQCQGACKKAFPWLDECAVRCHNNDYRS